MTELEGVGAAKKLTAEASMKDLKMEDFDTINPTQRNQRLAGLTRDASNWSVFAHPAGTELSRVAVNFQGLQGILERNVVRIGIALDYPLTRWTGEDPGGLHGNASAQASIRRYSTIISAFQRDHLNPVLNTLFPMIAADVGISEEVEWEWPSYIQKSDEERVTEVGLLGEALSKTTAGLQAAVAAGYLTEQEAAAYMQETAKSLFGQE